MGSAEELDASFERAFNAHDVSKLGGSLAEDVTYWEAFLPAPINGRNAVEDHLRGAWKTFPDASVRTTNRIVSGDWVVNEGEWSATNKGPINMPGQPPILPAGKKARALIVSVVKVDKDKIASMKIYYDNLAILVQLGLAPAPGSK